MKHDAVIVGGGFAGLAAATYLARARRSVCVIDTRRPRNRFADAPHDFLGDDGENRQALARRGVRVEAAKVTGLAGDGAALSAIVLDDGRRCNVEALHISGPPAPPIRTDAENMTTASGLYAAGARPWHSVSWAVADGVMAGTSAHRALVFG